MPQPDAEIAAAIGHNVEVDARGLLCPLPVLKARKRLIAMAPGQILRLLATDPAAVIDVPHFCQQTGHDFIGASDLPPQGPDLPPARAFLIRRGNG